MDHHCPWVGNCVGYNNHDYFWGFLLHGMTGCIFVWANMLPELIEKGLAGFHRLNGCSITFVVANAVSVSVGVLFGIHTFFLIKNYSSIEIAGLMSFNPFNHVKDTEVKDPESP
jgi:hypothetical protein